MNFSFSNLSLSGVTAAAAMSAMKPGRYLMKASEATIEDTKKKDGKVLKIKLKCPAGVAFTRINVANPSEQAVEIGLAELKALLECGGHPDPDNIGSHGVASINGLEMGVVIGNETYNGALRTVVNGYCKPEDVGTSPGAAPAAPKVGSKDIPF